MVSFVKIRESSCVAKKLLFLFYHNSIHQKFIRFFVIQHLSIR